MNQGKPFCKAINHIKSSYSTGEMQKTTLVFMRSMRCIADFWIIETLWSSSIEWTYTRSNQIISERNKDRTPTFATTTTFTRIDIYSLLKMYRQLQAVLAQHHCHLILTHRHPKLLQCGDANRYTSGGIRIPKSTLKYLETN